MVPLERSEAKYKPALPTSSKDTFFFNGALRVAALSIFEKPAIPIEANVLTGPEDKQLTLIPLGPKSTAKNLIADSKAALATPITL